MIRDTQKCKVLRERSKTKMPSLRKLSAMELGLEIQKAAHSSVCPPLSFQNPADRQVTDARATMALYRLHKVEWEQSVRPQTEAYRAKMGIVLGKGKDSGGKRKRDDESESEEGDDDEEARDKKKKDSFPGGGRKGVSSGLSVIVRRGGKRVDGPRQRGVPRPSNEIGGAGAASWWEDI
jgi:RNA exonuclease 4